MIISSPGEKVLSIDIGGSHIKSAVLDEDGNLLTNFIKVRTPVPSSPENILNAIQGLIKDFPVYTKISAGFPGYVKEGIVKTAPNLGTDIWQGVNLRKKLGDLFGKPVTVLNDADMQGLAIVSGVGFELVITLGTGFGFSFLQDGKSLPHLELSHHPITQDENYDDFIGDKALKKNGIQIWNIRAKKVLDILKTVFNYDRLYIGGGNAVNIEFELPENVKIVSNEDGIKGGAILWKQEKKNLKISH